MSVFRKKFKYDDALDVFSVHGMGGMFGALATGIFANPAINPLGKGLIFGNPKQLLIQAISVLMAAGIAIVGTVISLGLTRVITLGKLRVNAREETEGLDYSQHGEQLESK
jgi:Amt family ammonium transporter